MTRAYKSVRCIIRRYDKYLLAIHNNTQAETIGKWGLVGGHIEANEGFLETAQREVYEELKLHLNDWLDVADYPYKSYTHKVLASSYHGPKTLSFDKNEILELAWFSLEVIANMDVQGKLHTGFEHKAIRKYEAILALEYSLPFQNPMYLDWQEQA